MQTIVHAYCFDLRIKGEREAWDILREQLTASHPHCMESHGGGMHYQPALDGVEVELETTHLFTNQWNTAPVQGSKNGLRLFDWALDYEPHGNKHIKQGHYLDQTEEMRSIRQHRLKCGYCGKQYPDTYASSFCDACIGDEYLKESELYMLRLVRVSEDIPHRHWPALTVSEEAALVPAYKHAQLHGNTERDKVRIAKKRADLASNAEKTIANAIAERDGMLWLMDRGVSTDNAIYYNHTGRFCFGWRQPVNDADALRAAIDGFPFPYDIKETK